MAMNKSKFETVPVAELGPVLKGCSTFNISPTKNDASHAAAPAEIHGKPFQPGEPVMFSGIYKVNHFKHREDDAEIALVVGQKFPHCGPCDDLVQYIPVRMAPSLEEDFGARRNGHSARRRG